MKDRITGAILLKGECEDGVYPFPEHLRPNFKNVVAYVHERTTLDGWHKRLGHPLSKLVNHLIHVFSLSTNKNGIGIGIDGSKYYGSKYYVIFVDHYTKYIWLYPMTHK